MSVKLYKTEKENYVLVDPTKGTYDNGYMLGTSRESQYNKLSIKNCQAIERGYDLDDLDELAEEWVDMNGNKWSNNTNEVGDNYGSFKAGFHKALEVNADKRFTLKDMMDCWNKALKFQEHKETLGEYIQSLKQTEWDVEIEMEGPLVYPANLRKEGEERPAYRPKLDENGCLILKLIPKNDKYE